MSTDDIPQWAPAAAPLERTADNVELDALYAAGAPARIAESGSLDPDDLKTLLQANTFTAQAAQFSERLRARHEGKERPLPTPWPSLNHALTGKEDGGFWPGLHLLVGGTGSGKTQFALQCALEAAQRGVPVLYVNLELAPLDLFTRLAAMLTGQKWSTVWNGVEALRTHDAKGAPVNPVAALQALPFHWIDASRGWAYDRFIPHVEALRLHYPNRGENDPVLVVVDFLQLVGSPKGAREELRERIAGASYQCRQLARTHSAVVLAVSSTSRENYAKVSGDGEPWEQSAAALVGLGKESGETEFSADSVLILCREVCKEDGKGDGASPQTGTPVHIGVAKLRAGATNWIPLHFDGSELTEPKQVAPTSRPPERNGRPVTPDAWKK